MAAIVFFPSGIVTALDHVSAIPGNPVTPPNPVIPGNPVFPVAPASLIIDALFGETTTTVDILGVAGLPHDPLIG